MNPYRFPDGNVQVSFSGGRTSGYMLRHLIDANPDFAERAEVVFANTGREMPETLDFVQECGERWGVRIAWVEWVPGETGTRFQTVSHNSAARDGEPFEALVRWRGYLPNQHARFCTSELKVRTARDYLRSLGWDYWTAAVGIRADEPHRTGKADLRERWQRWTPLVTAGVSRHDVVAWWKRQPFDLLLPVVNGRSALGNCDGCFLKSEEHQAMLARDFPSRHAWWERMEAEAVKTAGTADGAQFRKEWSKRELREFVQESFASSCSGKATGYSRPRARCAKQMMGSA